MKKYFVLTTFWFICLQAFPQFSNLVQLYANDSTLGDGFGTSVDISGDYAIIGAPYVEDSQVADHGAAYIFQKDLTSPTGWTQIKKLLPATLLYNDNFGNAVAIDGEYAVVVAKGKLVNSNGSDHVDVAHIFKKNHGGFNNWGLLKSLSINIVVTHHINHAKIAVAIDDDHIILGKYVIDFAFSAGTTHIYGKNEGGPDNWGVVNRKWDWGDLTNFNRSHFGSSVDIQGDYALVGDSKADNPAIGISKGGVAYLYQKNSGGSQSWGLIKTIQSNDQGDFDEFGSQCSKYDTLIAISSRRAVYLFSQNTGGPNNWGQLKKITHLPTDTSFLHGTVGTIHLDSGLLAIGFPEFQDDRGLGQIHGQNQGGNDNWGVQTHINPPQTKIAQHLGRGVGIDGQCIALGAPQYAVSQPGPGYVLITSEVPLALEETLSTNPPPNSLIVSPNPSEGKALIQTTTNGKFHICIRTSSGKVAWQKDVSISQKKVQVTFPKYLIPGLYILELNSQSGNVFRTKIVLK